MKQKIYPLIILLFILYQNINADQWSKTTIFSSGSSVGISGGFSNFGIIGQPLAGEVSDARFNNLYGFIFDNETLNLPILTTNAISAITASSANSGGNITFDGGSEITERGVCWNTTGNPTIQDNRTSNGTGTGNYESFLTNLNPETTYHVRAYAINSSGIGYGEEFTFLTHFCPITCGMVLTCNATLTEDLDCSGYTDGPAITIGADNITLDLNGQTITAAPGQVGVFVGASNVIITSSQPGGKIDGSGTAIQTNNIAIQGLTISNIDLSYTGVSESSGYGINIGSNYPISGINIENTSVKKREIGFLVSQSYQISNVLVSNSIFEKNKWNGLNLNGINGLILSNVNVKNNGEAAVVFGGMSGNISISNVDVSGSGIGLYFRDQAAGFPTIVPGMFTGFGTTNTAISVYSSGGGGLSSDIKVSGEDLSWTGNSMPTGYGFVIGANGSVSNITIENTTIKNRLGGFLVFQSPQTTDVTITNSVFDNNFDGLVLYGINGLVLSDLSVQSNNEAVVFGGMSGNISISNVDVSGSGIGLYFRDQAGGFPTIVPGMFTGFGTTNTAISVYSSGGGGLSSDIKVSGEDLSWTGSSTPTGNGFVIGANGPVSNITIENTTIKNRLGGFLVFQSPQTTDVTITNSVFDNNFDGLVLYGINGLVLSDLSVQNNNEAVVFGGMSGNISISNVNVGGSGIGVYFRDQAGGFPTIVPGMFTGFGTTNTAISVYSSGGGGLSSDIKVSGEDLSWTGSSTPTGNGFVIGANGPVSNITIENTTFTYRQIGFLSFQSPQTTDITINNSVFDNNLEGIVLRSVNSLELFSNSIRSNNSSLFLESLTNYSIYNNNICSSSGPAVVGDGPYELWNHTTLEGNYWCVTCNDMGFIPGTTSSRLDIIDNYAYGTESGWLLPASNPDSKPCQKAPIVDAGPAETTVLLGSSVTLEGTATDPNGDPIIQYEWSVVTAPASSAFTGVISAIASFSFTPDVAGEFVLAFRAYDGYGWSEPDQINVHCISNRPPVAICQNITLPTDENCMVDASINNGSYDPDEGDQITLTQNPAGPYPLGNTTVTLTVTDSKGLSSSCEGIVTVQDVTAPVISCIGTDQNIIPSDGLCSYTHSGTSWDATATDNCSEAITLTYNLSGATTGSGSTLAGVILNPGTTLVTWTAEDEAGNTSQSSFKVIVDYNTALIYVYGALHTTGSGRTPVTSKTALLLDLKIFDKTGISPDPKDFELIWNTYQALPTSVISISEPVQCSLGGGSAYKYTLTVPSSNCISSNGYLIIGKAVVDGIAIYTGSPVGEMNTGSTSNKYLQVIKNANGKKAPAITSVVNGSLLLIAEPEYIEFTESEELFPVICESVDGNWSIQVNAEPPEGFTSTPGTLNTDVNTSNINTVQFTIKDIGSKWTHTNVSHKIRHKGKDIELITKPGMIDKQKKKKEVEDYEQETTSFVDELSVRLKQNYPNPFAQLTEIQYFVSQREHATLLLTDINGRVVANLIDKYVSPGWNTLIVNGSGLTAGTYILRLESMGKAAMMKIVKMD